MLKPIICWKNDLEALVTKVKKAVFPVGGMGTRFLPATKALPKEMLPIANKPLIQHAFEEAVDAGIEEFIFITGRNKNIIINHFDCVYELEKILSENEKHEALALTRDWVPKAGNIAFIRQQHPLGLGHAVWCARHFIKDEPFAVLLADELFISKQGNNLLSEMITLYNKHRANIIAVADIERSQTEKYGIIQAKNDDGKIIEIEDMVEKPKPQDAPSNISIIGRYILDSSVFSFLEKTPKGKGGEIQLTDALRLSLRHAMTYGYRFTGQRFDCGNPIGLLEAYIEFSLRDAKMGEAVVNIIKKIANNI